MRKLLQLLIVVASSLLGCAQSPTPAACPPLEHKPAPAAAEALEERISALAAAEGTVSITITEDEATAYLQHRLLSDNTIKPRITLRNETICVETNLPCLGRQLPVVAELTPYVADGHLAVKLTTLSLQGRRIPGWLRHSAESTLNELLVELGGTAIVRSAALQDHSLTLVIQLPSVH